MRSATGRPHRATTSTAMRSGEVQSAVSHPGLWVGTSSGERLYIHVADPQHVARPARKRQRLRFTGRLFANAPEFATIDAVTPAEGAALLTLEGAHIEVPRRPLPPADDLRSAAVGLGPVLGRQQGDVVGWFGAHGLPERREHHVQTRVEFALGDRLRNARRLDETPVRKA